MSAGRRGAGGRGEQERAAADPVTDGKHPEERAQGAGDAACGPEIDPAGAVFAFVESPIYETMLSMQALLVEWYEEPWAEEAREAMGVSYLRELQATLGPFRNGVDLFELAVPEAAPQEVPSFLEHLRSMPFGEFSYYVLGRLIPMKGGQLSIDPEGIRDLFDNYGSYTHYLERLTQADWQAKGPTYRSRYADLIEEFWERYFREHYPALSVQRSVSIAKNEAYGRRHGVEPLYRLITGRERMHLLVSPDEELTRVSFIPIVSIAHPCYIYSGPHEITVLYHASRTPDRIEELSEKERHLVALSRALGDKTRFQIMKLLFQFHEALNGQNIADKVHVSKSVVSKHLRQLKEAGIVEETSPDRRNNLYSVNVAALREISPALLEVLRG